MDDRQKLYDQILATLYQNISAEDSYCSGIYIDGYGDNALSYVYMVMANTYADLNEKPINMVMPFFKYVKFILKNWKGRKRYKRCYLDLDYMTSIDIIAGHVSKYYGQPISIYDEIYEEYYNK